MTGDARRLAPWEVARLDQICARARDVLVRGPFAERPPVDGGAWFASDPSDPRPDGPPDTTDPGGSPAENPSGSRSAGGSRTVLFSSVPSQDRPRGATPALD